VKGRVLIVAGSDSGGGAGIQADIKTVTALGAYAATAVTALTAQNTEGVAAIHDIPADFVAEQMRVVLDDIGADCLKAGMLHRPEIIETVCDVVEDLAPGVPFVVDPVMIAKGGASLLAEAAVETLKQRLIPLTAVLTPNLPEAEALVGDEAGSVDDAVELARAVLSLGPHAVFLTGGHREGAEIVDVLVDRDGTVERFTGPRIETRHTHGTGCTIASAIAAGLAQGMALVDAIHRARAYTFEAIRTAPGYGAGHGPINHAHTVRDGQT
jgi:hydroxymethylpyrimidine/phosphomethylpyrimidine kinase